MSNDTEILSQADSGDGSPPPGDSPGATGGDLRAEIERALSSEPDTGARDDETDATKADADASDRTSVAAEGGRAPQSWKNDARDDWESIPARAQAEIQRREQEIQSKLSETADARKMFDGLAPYVEEIRANGIEPAEYIGNLLQWNAALRQQPADALAALSQQFIQDARSARALVNALAERFGLDGGGDYDRGDYDQPKSSAQVTQLEQRLRAAEIAAAKREWVDFEKTNPPHLADLKPDIAEQIRLNPRLSYAEAYDRAKWANPAVRERLIADEARGKAKARDQAAGAARSRALPRGRSDESVTDGGTLRSEIEAAYHRGRR